jgi:hypothetical protein
MKGELVELWPIASALLGMVVVISIIALFERRSR